MDLDERVTSWNPAAEQLFGWSQPEALGRNIDELVLASAVLHDEGEAVTRQALEEALRSGRRAERKDGRLVDVELLLVPLSSTATAPVTCSSTTTSRPPRRPRPFRRLAEAAIVTTSMRRSRLTTRSARRWRSLHRPQCRSMFGYPPPDWGDNTLWEAIVHRRIKARPGRAAAFPGDRRAAAHRVPG